MITDNALTRLVAMLNEEAAEEAGEELTSTILAKRDDGSMAVLRSDEVAEAIASVLNAEPAPPKPTPPISDEQLDYLLGVERALHFVFGAPLSVLLAC